MFYIGTDIVDIARIRDNLKHSEIKFLNRIFTKNEIDYCNSKTDPAIHFAGRFAAKEAVKKALLSSRIISKISMKEIDIISKKNIPQVEISSLSMCDIKVSISHVKSFAVATAILIDSK